jgi:Bacterial Ig domain/Putative Ig domain
MTTAPPTCGFARAAAAVGVLTLAAMPAFGATIFVPAGANLQAALTAAAPGDVILLEAGAVFQGKYTLPVKPNPHGLFITVRSAADDAQLPSPGTRITPESAPLLPKLKSSDTLPVLNVPPGASYWRVQFIEFQANATGSSDIIRVGSHLETVPTRQPHHIVFDRVYVRGDPTTGQKNGIVAHASDFELRDSYIADMKLVGVETHGFVSYNGAGPYLIENNYIEAAGVNVLFGGADPTNASMIPSNIIFRRNHLTKNLEWMSPNASGTYWTVKNLFEIKTARVARIQGNILEHNWTGAGDQPGYAVLLRTENQSGRCGWCETADLVFEHNVVRHSPAGLSLIGLDQPSTTTSASVRMRDVIIRNNLFDDIDRNRWLIGVTKGSAMFALVDGVERLTLDHNTIIIPSSTSVMYFVGATPSSDFAYTNNMSEHKLYGMKGGSVAAGNATLAAYTVNPLVRGNVLAGGSASTYPAGNFFPTVADWQAEFADYASGDYRLRDNSAYVAAAADGTNLGTDLAKISAALAGRLAGTNDPPVADARLVSVAEDVAQPITLTATDPNGDPLTFSVVAAPAPGVLSGAPPHVTYTPAANYSGTDRFTFDVLDGGGGRSTAVVTVSVTPVNDAPVAQAQSVFTSMETPIRFTLEASDVDSQVLTFTMPSVIGSGTLTHVSGATFEYVPNGGFTGDDSAEYTVSDGELSATAVVAIQVGGALSITTTSLPSARLRRTYSQQLQVSGGAAPYTWSLIDGSLPPGLVLGASDGTISGRPTEPGTYQFTVRVTDGRGTTDTALLSLRVRRG